MQVMRRNLEAPRRNWSLVARMALMATGGALALSLALLYLLLFFDGLTATGLGLTIAILIPVAIGLPLGLAVGLLRDDVRRLGQRINRAATYDPATGSLNAAVLVSEVERRRQVGRSGDPRKGAFLIVELAKLRAHQHHNGFSWAEDAMRVVGAAVRGAVREGDIFGRLDGSSFGLFLPDADESDARGISRRIHAAVAEVYVTPAAGDEALTVRIGGILCESTTEFDAMFRAAVGEVDRAGARDVALATLPGQA